MLSHARYLVPLLAVGALMQGCGGGSEPAAATTVAAIAAAPAGNASTLATDTALAASTVLAHTQSAAIANDAGAAQTFSSAGFIDRANPFFRPMGNGRSCATCHQESEGWTLRPQGLLARFNASNGNDPVFRTVDGANSPALPTDTLDQKRIAYSLLLTKGLIRIGLPIAAGAEFELLAVDDPYGFASAKELSLFRRPLPSTNLKFLSTVMWDARETTTDVASADCLKGGVAPACFATVAANLLHQANSAVRGHAEATRDLSTADQRAIVDFETGLFTAQVNDTAAGSLTANGALGGPINLAANNYYFGVNDFVSGDYRTGAAFRTSVFGLFGAWRTAPPAPGSPPPSGATAARDAIARGEGIFNNRPMNIAGVNGLNDVLRVATVRGTCTSCHDTPNAGGHSVPRLFDTGVADGRLRTVDLPLYTLRNVQTGETLTTADPGAAMLSGKWSDIGRFKTPGLRGLAARAPYFHNGAARELEDVVRFYDRRFRMGLTPQEITDLTAFLRAL